MAQAYSMIEIGGAKCSHFDPTTKFWSSLNTCISYMKHSIALIFNMVAPYLVDINFTNLERMHCRKKSYFTSKYAQAAKLQKTCDLVVEKWHHQTLFSIKNFLRVERGFLKVLTHQHSTLFQNCNGMRFCHLIVFS